MPKYTITYEQAGQKILAYVQKTLSIPEVVAHKLIRKGTIRINSKRIKPFTHIAEGDIIYLPTLQEKDIPPPPIAIYKEKENSIKPYTIYEDAELLVLNKPPNLPVHNGTRHTDSIASRVQHLYADASFTPTLVHRLDKETTGILLLAKSHRMLTNLHEYWRANAVKKYYLAWVRGIWEEESPFTVHNFLERTTEKVIIGEKGDPVSITISCIQKARSSSLLLIQLHTGKTHQIRAQLAHKGFPILGENKYANNSKKLPLYLHSTALFITDTIQFYAMPQHWKGVFALRSTNIYTPEYCQQLLTLQ